MISTDRQKDANICYSLFSFYCRVKVGHVVHMHAYKGCYEQSQALASASSMECVVSIMEQMASCVLIRLITCMYDTNHTHTHTGK